MGLAHTPAAGATAAPIPRPAPVTKQLDLRRCMREAEDRSSGNDLLDQDSILNIWFERGGYLCLKFLLPSSDDLRQRIGPRERTPD
ncbi:MAG TPA: hypothetical protein VK828_17425 [Terriglobales bacterium]|jgi:hypothetical protein|nr:hypothetical protein [Terriglobales bacterium]